MYYDVMVYETVLGDIFENFQDDPILIYFLLFMFLIFYINNSALKFLVLFISVQKNISILSVSIYRYNKEC